jgi:hypothetical protein
MSVQQPGLQSLSENLCRPYGTQFVFLLYPGLTPGANTNAAPPPPQQAQRRRLPGTADKAVFSRPKFVSRVLQTLNACVTIATETTARRPAALLTYHASTI